MSHSLAAKNHILFFDNYFASVQLLRYLKDRSIYACCTVRKDRKHLPELTVDRKMKRGESDWRATSDDLVYIKWKDNRAVHLLSTAYGTEAARSTGAKRMEY